MRVEGRGGQARVQGGSRDPQKQRVYASVALQQTVQPCLGRVTFALRVKRRIERVHLWRHEVALRPRVECKTLVAVTHGLVHLRSPCLQILKPLFPSAVVALHIRACQLLQATEEIIRLAWFGGQRQDEVAGVWVGMRKSAGGGKHG